MISFITLSREPEKVTRLRENLRDVFQDETFELLHIDGSTYDLFAGYNHGALQAQGDVLAFLHDDVELLCHRRVFDKPLALLQKPLTGLVGVAGTRTLPADGCWWKSPQEDCRGAAFHPSPSDPVFGMHLNPWPHLAAKFGPVAVLDGVFLMVRKATLHRLGGFAAGHYQGFHFYDLDLTFRATLAGLTNYAAPLPLFHRSPGRPNDNWEVNRQLFVRRFAGKLPFRLQK